MDGSDELEQLRTEVQTLKAAMQLLATGSFERSVEVQRALASIDRKLDLIIDENTYFYGRVGREIDDIKQRIERLEAEL